MRVLTSSGKNEIEIQDTVSDSVIKFFYRLPTYEERIRYSNELYVKKGNKFIMHPKVRVKYGAIILTGIGEDCFADSKGKAISSDKKSDNYNPKWKDLIAEHAPELLAHLAVQVFENSFESKKAINYGFEIEVDLNGEQKEKPDPFVKS